MNLEPLTPLEAYRQFILVQRDGKLPLDHRTLVPHSAHDPAVWMSYQDATHMAAGLGAGSYGVGFVLTAADSFFCLDIDGAMEPTGWSGLSQQLVAALPGCVTEVSQSGRGLHIWGKRTVMPPHASKNIELHIELYHEARYMLLGSNAVGTMADDCPAIDSIIAVAFKPREHGGTAHGEGPCPEWRGPTDDTELLRRAMQSRSANSAFGGGASFADLYQGNLDVLARAYPASGDGPYDGSSADAALLQHLAFWTGKDAERMERLLRASGLARPKHDREDYMSRSVANACSMQREVLQDAVPIPGPSVTAVAAAQALQPDVAPTIPLAEEVRAFTTPYDQAELFRGCVYVVDQHRVLVPGGQLLKPDQFKVMFGGRTFQMDMKNERTSRDAFEAFTQSQALITPKADSTCFRPDLLPGQIVQQSGRTRANTWWPVPVESSKADAAHFVNHVHKLLPNGRDADTLLSFMAFCVQYLGRKATWSVLLQGVEGNGKSFFSEVLNYCLGSRYVYPLKSAKIGAQFNGYLVGKLLICIEDVYASKSTVNVMEELKDLIAGGPSIEVEKKGVDQFNDEICCNFIMNSNHRDALKLTRNGRRICWLACAQQEKADLQRHGLTPQYFGDLYGWLRQRGGYAATLGFLQRFPIPDDLNPAKGAVIAPETTTSAQAVADNLDAGERTILDAIDECRPGFKGGWISTIAVKTLLEAKRLMPGFPQHKWRGFFLSQGYDTHSALTRDGGKGQTDNSVLPDAGRPVLYLKKDHEALSITQRVEVARAYARAQTATG